MIGRPMRFRLRTLLIVLALGPLVVAGAWLVVGACCWSALAHNRQLNVQNYTQVRVGMSQAEVEELLGGPPGNYGRHTGGGWMTLEGFIEPPGSVERIWCDDSNRFEIYFDAQNGVVARHKRSSYQQSPSKGFSGSWRQFRRYFGL